MNYKEVYYFTHYLWLFQLLLNIVLYIKYIFFRKKYKKNSLILSDYFLFKFPILVELIYGFVFIMFDYVYNTRKEGDFNGVLEIFITISLLLSNILLFFSSRWRVTFLSDKIIYHNLWFSEKNIFINEINFEDSYIIKPLNRKFLHIGHYQYLLLKLKNNAMIKLFSALRSSCFLGTS